MVPFYGWRSQVDYTLINLGMATHRMQSECNSEPMCLQSLLPFHCSHNLVLFTSVHTETRGAPRKVFNRCVWICEYFVYRFTFAHIISFVWNALPGSLYLVEFLFPSLPRSQPTCQLFWIHSYSNCLHHTISTSTANDLVNHIVDSFHKCVLSMHLLSTRHCCKPV